jgi:hypothetical protein
MHIAGDCVALTLPWQFMTTHSSFQRHVSTDFNSWFVVSHSRPILWGIAQETIRSAWGASWIRLVFTTREKMAVEIEGRSSTLCQCYSSRAFASLPLRNIHAQLDRAAWFLLV